MKYRGEAHSNFYVILKLLDRGYIERRVDITKTTPEIAIPISVHPLPSPVYKTMTTWSLSIQLLGHSTARQFYSYTLPAPVYTIAHMI